MHDAEFVLISDVHLGSHLLQVDLLINFIKALQHNSNLKKLIINGDFIDNSNFNWPAKHWQVITEIDKLKEAGVEIVWVVGNHDRFVPNKILYRLFQYTITNKYTWTSLTNRFTAIHGDCWDPTYYPDRGIKGFIFKSLYKIYRYISKRSPKVGRKLPYKTKLISNKINEVVEAVYKGSRKLSTQKKTSVFTGHTHVSMLKLVGSYVIGNDGSWTNEVPTFIAIKSDRVALWEYDGNKYKLREAFNVST